jgi:hypothetical protein
VADSVAQSPEVDRTDGRRTISSPNDNPNEGVQSLIGVHQLLDKKRGNRENHHPA